jgi:hypothetical protein
VNSIELKGTFLSRRKGDIITEGTFLKSFDTREPLLANTKNENWNRPVIMPECLHIAARYLR